MMNTSKSQACKLAKGTVVKGKWHKNSYRIIKTLGYGATGYVYLASCRNNGFVALKVSEDSMAITSEVNVLRHFSKVQGVALGPSLLDVDDWIQPNHPKAVPFYVMEYLNGSDFLSFIDKRSQEWLGVIVLQLLSDLDRLHQQGWVFGDLKPDNLLVTGPPPKIRWLDVGGTTLLGRSIKEYTEFYDRGYWGLGSRKAEPAYDLFAVAMIMLNTKYPNRFAKNGEGMTQLIKATQSQPSLNRYEKMMFKAWQGKYQRAQEMKVDLLKVMGRSDRPVKMVKKQAKKPRPQPSRQPTTVKKVVRKKSTGIFETILIALALFLAYVLYLYGQLF